MRERPVADVRHRVRGPGPEARRADEVLRLLSKHFVAGEGVQDAQLERLQLQAEGAVNHADAVRVEVQGPLVPQVLKRHGERVSVTRRP